MKYQTVKLSVQSAHVVAFLCRAVNESGTNYVRISSDCRRGVILLLAAMAAMIFYGVDLSVFLSPFAFLITIIACVGVYAQLKRGSARLSADWTCAALSVDEFSERPSLERLMNTEGELRHADASAWLRREMKRVTMPTANELTAAMNQMDAASQHGQAA